MTAAVPRAAAVEDEDAVVALWDEAFGEPGMAAQWRLDPVHRSWTLVAEDADGIAGALYLVDQRRHTATGRVARVLGIANVAVAQRARGRGVARELMDDAVAFGRRAGYDWALLFTGTPGVYAGSGFLPFRQHRRLDGVLADAAASGPLGVERAPIRAIDPAALAAHYDAACADRPLTAVRDGLGWARAAGWYAGATVYTHRSGYAVARPQAGEVLEAAGRSDALAAIGHAVAADLRAAGVTSVSAHLPAGEPFDALLATVVADGDRPDDDTGMFHPLDSGADAVRATVGHPRAHHWTGDYL
ncbi:GNAT family N-acetyltransferase [Leifsonia sp. NPDC080035]|uniref:GNAT family N-acetyltransferase n=1 Tax=Leifsonia sp. NPDC080035 TaxID=3143936 RepID=A0AAU7GFN8_9MICO